MRQFLLMFLFLNSQLVLGQTRISDISYIPEAQTSYLELSGVWASGEARLSSQGAIANLSTSGSEYQLFYAYGLTENGVIGLSFSRAQSETESTVGTTVNTSKSKGLSDPELGYLHRFTPSDDPLKADVTLVLVPAIQKAKNSTTTHDGNMAIGGHVVELRSRVTQETESYGLALTVKGTQYFKAESKDSANGEKEERAAFFSPGATLSGQLKASPQFALNIELGYQFIPKRTYKESDGSKVDFDSTDNMDFRVEISILPRENLMIQAGFFSSQTSSYNGNYPTTIVEIADQKETAFTLGIAHTF